MSQVGTPDAVLVADIDLRAVADEVEGKTLTYLLTRPIRRGSGACMLSIE